MQGENAVRGAPCSHPSPTRAVLGTSLNEATPTRRGKPEGVIGAEVWFKLVDSSSAPPAAPPVHIGDPASFSFLTLTTRPTVRSEFRVADGGKMAVYMLRWVSTRGDKGPWSDVAKATVAA